MQQVEEVLALGFDMECSLIPLRGVMGMGLFCTPDYPNGPLSMYLGLDSHYAGRRVTGCRHWQSRSKPIAKNTGVECECISTVLTLLSLHHCGGT